MKKARRKGVKRKYVRRIETRKDPVLHIHNYVLAIHSYKGNPARKSTKLYYAVNMKEAIAIRDAQRKGAVIECFKAEHNYLTGWQK